MLGCPEDSPDNWTKADLHQRSVQVSGIQRAPSVCRQRWTHGIGWNDGELRKNWWRGEHAYRNLSLGDEQIFLTLREPVGRIVSHLSAFLPNVIKNVKTDSELAQTIISHPNLGKLMTHDKLFVSTGGAAARW